MKGNKIVSLETIPDEDYEDIRDVEAKNRVNISCDSRINLPLTHAILTDSKNHIKDQLKVLEATISLVENRNQNLPTAQKK
eukprot:14744495-Ditylum_brightwellii.AAC.1